MIHGEAVPDLHLGSGQVILDCDDVLLDWLRGFRGWLGAERGVKPDPVGPLTFCMRNWLRQGDRDVIRKFVRDFNASPYLADLEPITGAVEGVAAIREADMSIAVLTSFATGAAGFEARRANLAKVFGDAFREVILLDLGASKRAALDRLAPSVFVDDRIEHARDGAAAGHFPIIMQTSSNVADRINEPDAERFAWAADWGGLTAMLRLDTFEPEPEPFP